MASSISAMTNVLRSTSSIALALPAVLNPLAMMKKRTILFSVYALGFLLAEPGWAGAVPLQAHIDGMVRKIEEEGPLSISKFMSVLGAVDQIEGMDTESARYAKDELNRVLRECFTARHFATNRYDLQLFLETLKSTVTPGNREKTIEYLFPGLYPAGIQATFILIRCLFEICEERNDYRIAYVKLLKIMGEVLKRSIWFLRQDLEDGDSKDPQEIRVSLDSHLSLLEQVIGPKPGELLVVQIPLKTKIDATMGAIRKAPMLSNARFELISAAFDLIAAMDEGSANYAKRELNVELRASFTPYNLGGSQDDGYERVESFLDMLELTVTPETRNENIDFLSRQMIEEDELLRHIPVFVIRSLFGILQTQVGYRKEHAPRLYLMGVLLEEAISKQNDVLKASDPNSILDPESDLAFCEGSLRLIQGENEPGAKSSASLTGTSVTEEEALLGQVAAQTLRELALTAARIRTKAGRPLPPGLLDQVCSLALLAPAGVDVKFRRAEQR